MDLLLLNSVTARISVQHGQCLYPSGAISLTVVGVSTIPFSDRVEIFCASVITEIMGRRWRTNSCTNLKCYDQWLDKYMVIKVFEVL